MSDPEPPSIDEIAEQEALEAAEWEWETPTVSPLSVNVDVNALLADLGEQATWELLGKLKDLFA